MITTEMGGLNGDGFFNEEYGGILHDEYNGASGYIASKRIDDFGVNLTGTMTARAVQLQTKEGVVFWMPKVAMSKPHYLHVQHWAIPTFIRNMISARQNTDGLIGEV